MDNKVKIINKIEIKGIVIEFKQLIKIDTVRIEKDSYVM